MDGKIARAGVWELLEIRKKALSEAKRIEGSLLAALDEGAIVWVEDEAFVYRKQMEWVSSAAHAWRTYMTKWKRICDRDARRKRRLMTSGGGRCRGTTMSLVMTGSGVDDQFVSNDLEDESVGLVDVDAPTSRKIAAKRFRLTNAAVAVAVYAFKKLVDLLERSCVAALPVGIFRPRTVVPELLHETFILRLRTVRRDWAFAGFSSASTSMRSW